MPSPFVYDDKLHRYRNVETGRIIGKKQLLTLRDSYIESQKAGFERLATKLSNGDITIQRWQSDFREALKDTYINEYAVGRGGRHNFTQQDYGSVGGMLGNQYRYLDNFAEQIARGELSTAQIQMRSRMYVDSATQAFERGRGRAMGVPELPAYPGDGSTQCKSNCKCSWQIVEAEATWDCTWKLGIAEHCPDCVDRASRWAPYQIAKPL
jgi:hypothetical protein